MSRDADRETMAGATDTMARAADTMGRPAHSIDDDDIARLVRDVVAGWAMPPVRLDAPAWRDRTRNPRARRLDSLGAWLGRLGQAAAGALVLTVAAALIGVYLTGVGKPSSSARGSGSPGSSPAGADATPLPKLLVVGALPSPDRVVVEDEQGQYAVADLGTGRLGAAFTTTGRDSVVTRAPNGDVLCLCTSFDTPKLDQDTHVTVVLERFDASSKSASRTPVLDVTGQPDPRDGLLPAEPSHVTVATTFSRDGRYAYVGWSARAHPDWTSGIVVVDLASGGVVERVGLPSHSDGVGDTRIQVDAPKVVGEAAGEVIIDRHSWSFSPATAMDPTYTFGTEVFTASVTDGRLGSAIALEQAGGCGEDVNAAGGLPDGGLWLSCLRDGGSPGTTLRRLHPDRSLAGDTTVSGSLVEGTTAVVSSDERALYLWDPIRLTLHRLDLATGIDRTATAPATTGSRGDALSAVGRWLTPSALAKTLLQPGLAVSPDGSRAYALGISEDSGGPGMSGSLGVVLFDTAAMAAVGRWAPTADFVSVAVSADGRSVYAAGAAGVTASGTRTAGPASITVFDAATGGVRLIAGELGYRILTFTAPILQ